MEYFTLTDKYKHMFSVGMVPWDGFTQEEGMGNTRRKNKENGLTKKIGCKKKK